MLFYDFRRGIQAAFDLHQEAIHFEGNLLKGNIDRLVNGMDEPTL